MLGHLNTQFEGMTVDQACHPAEIETFTGLMLGKGLKPTYVLLTILKAAVRRAWNRRELSTAPHIAFLEAKSTSTKGRPLKPSEIAALLSSAAPHMEAMLMICLGTACRPAAACDLTWSQIDLEAGLIDLNPAGRMQTKKYRPVVRIPPKPSGVADGAKTGRAPRPVRPDPRTEIRDLVQKCAYGGEAGQTGDGLLDTAHRR
jgi:integrase